MLFLLLQAILIASALALWPQPRQYDHGSSVLWLSPDVRLLHTSNAQAQPFGQLWDNFIPWAHGRTSFRALLTAICQLCFSYCPSKQTTQHQEHLVQLAFERMKRNVFNRSFVPRKFHPRSAPFEPSINGSKQYIKEIRISESASEDMEDEAYALDLGEDGKVMIRIGASIGGLRALESFAQLFFVHSDPDIGSYTPYAPTSIEDSPAFTHRGLNLDISRNWIPPADVMRTIEAMAATKLNRLHLHASDAQSWPLELPSLPDLAQKGAYDLSQIWHTEDLEMVQRHGTTFGVEVFVEIDMPGHTTSIGISYPHLTTAKDEQWDKYAVEPPSGQLRLNSTEVPPFIDTLLTDLLGCTSEHSRFFHLGGDELNRDAYLLDPTVKSSSKEVIRPLLQTLIDQVISLAKLYSLTVIMWEELVLEWDLALTEDVVVQAWRGNPDNAVSLLLKKGYKTIFGSNAYWYLDCGFGAFLDPETSNSATPIKSPYLDYCQPYKNWRHMYAYDPLRDIPEHQKHLVVGGEAHLWGELTDSINLDGMLWPRLAAAAEVMWSGTGKKPDESTTRRLADFRERLLMAGVRSGVVQMEWCLRHKGGCTL